MTLSAWGGKSTNFAEILSINVWAQQEEEERDGKYLNMLSSMLPMPYGCFSASSKPVPRGDRARAGWCCRGSRLRRPPGYPAAGRPGMPHHFSSAERLGALCLQEIALCHWLLAMVRTFKVSPCGFQKAGWWEELLVCQQCFSSPGRGCFPCPAYFFLCSCS